MYSLQFFKVFIEFVTLRLRLYVLVFFGPKACGILAPRPGIEPTPPALEGEVDDWTASQEACPVPDPCSLRPGHAGPEDQWPRGMGSFSSLLVIWALKLPFNLGSP